MEILALLLMLSFQHVPLEVNGEVPFLEKMGVQSPDGNIGINNVTTKFS